jgi:hypothetical protein
VNPRPREQHGRHEPGGEQQPGRRGNERPRRAE